jgi:hypothetical protein
MDYVLASLDMFSGTADNLINFTFNVSVTFMQGDADSW